MLNAQNYINQTSNKIAQEINPEKIILFGSYAWGNPQEDSDIDLFIISKTANPTATIARINKVISPRLFPIDILVRTPENVQQKLDIEDTFYTDIFENGKILYDRSAKKPAQI